jgi:GNAT superfamily N-acetyltransferase
MSEVLGIELPGALPAAWFELAAQVHAGDPRWIPEEPATIGRDFHPLNPWFQTGRARGFLVPGKARLCAFFDPRGHVDGKLSAYFGDFVTSGDHAAEDALFAAAEAWARAQGSEQLIGPLHMTTWQNYRALVSMSPGRLPFPGEPYDAPSVPAALERLGFRPICHYVSQFMDRKGFEGMAARLVASAAAPLAAGYRAEAEGVDAALGLLGSFYESCMVIFRDNFAFTPPAKEVWMAGMRSALRRACPHTTLIGRAPDGSVVGFIVNYPNWAPLVVQGAAARLKVDELDYRTHFARLGPEPEMVFKTMGVLPEHQSSRVGSLLMGRAAELGLAHYTTAIAATVRDDNRSRRYAGPFQIGEHNYALYGREH